MRYRGKRHRGMGAYKRLLRRGDRQRIRRALCRVEPDEKRAYYRLRYDPWAWD